MGLTDDGLRDWLSKTDRITVWICAWSYVVHAEAKCTWIKIDFEGQGASRNSLRPEVPVVGEFVFLTDVLARDWSGHPLQNGEISLRGRSESASLNVELRLSDECRTEIWKAFVLGACSHDKSRLTLSVGVKSLTPADCEIFGEHYRLLGRVDKRFRMNQ